MTLRNLCLPIYFLYLCILHLILKLFFITLAILIFLIFLIIFPNLKNLFASLISQRWLLSYHIFRLFTVIILCWLCLIIIVLLDSWLIEAALVWCAQIYRLIIHYLIVIMRMRHLRILLAKSVFGFRGNEIFIRWCFKL